LIGEDVRAVWVASVPRTGSMWTFNIARDLVRATGQPALPALVPHDDAEMESIGRAGIAAGDGVYVLKVHTRIPADLPHSVYLVTHRNLRDSLVSFMRFMHADFDAGLRFVAGAIRLEQHFAGFPPECTLDIAYADIIGTPETVVEAIAVRLAVPLEAGQAAGLVGRYAKDKVQARLVERERALRERIGAGQPVDARDFVPMGDRTVRAFDVETGFQSGHVSSYREGDWRTILTDGQKAAVENLIADARAHGFTAATQP
jgi:hypothetical protein